MAARPRPASWQTGHISGLYFQSFRLAHDLAKRAERCLRFELGLTDSSYVGSGQWDSVKKGLLAGEKLQYDLRRLETAYLELGRRELELTKHVSLVRLDPRALVLLRETGRCFHATCRPAWSCLRCNLERQVAVVAEVELEHAAVVLAAAGGDRLDRHVSGSTMLGVLRRRLVTLRQVRCY